MCEQEINAVYLYNIRTNSVYIEVFCYTNKYKILYSFVYKNISMHTKFVVIFIQAYCIYFYVTFSLLQLKKPIKFCKPKHSKILNFKIPSAQFLISNKYKSRKYTYTNNKLNTVLTSSNCSVYSDAASLFPWKHASIIK